MADKYPGREALTAEQALDARLSLKSKLVPKEGFNVVAVDIFEGPGEDATIHAHCDTLEEAEAIVARDNSESVPLYIYGPDTT